MTVNVLVIDQDDAHRGRLVRKLSRYGIEVVGQGPRGDSPATGSPEGEPPDVLLLHTSPSLDGQVHACRSLKAHPGHPFMLVVGDLGRGDTQRALDEGADAIVSPAVGIRSLARLLTHVAGKCGETEDARTGKPQESDEGRTPTRTAVSRRGFLGGALAATTGAVALNVLEASPAFARAGIPPRTDLDLPKDNDAILLRMQQDLQRALRKPVEQRRWAMVIDLRKCIGCSACTVACVAENHLPPGVVYRPVTDIEVGTYPNVARQFLPRPCMQCDSPPCVDVCPVSATHKRPDGVVEIDYDKCIGCRYCIPACPYGARTFDWGEYWTDGTPSREGYETAAAPEYGKRWPRKGGRSPIGNVRKCTFCLHRLNAGMLPSCTTTCVGGATYFGDGSDPKSLVAQLIGSERVERLKEELGTKPKVYYLR